MKYENCTISSLVCVLVLTVLASSLSVSITARKIDLVPPDLVPTFPPSLLLVVTLASIKSFYLLLLEYLIIPPYSYRIVTLIEYVVGDVSSLHNSSLNFFHRCDPRKVCTKVTKIKPVSN